MTRFDAETKPFFNHRSPTSKDVGHLPAVLQTGAKLAWCCGAIPTCDQDEALGLPIAIWMAHFFQNLKVGLVGGLAVLIAVGGCTPLGIKQADNSLKRGDARLKAEDYDAALLEFQNAVELNPKLAVAYSKIGLISRHKGNLDQAAGAYAEAVKLNPYSFDDSFSLAQVYHQLMRFADAVRAYAHACELQPTNLEARLNLGVCYHQASELDNAIDCYTQASQIDPKNPAPYTNMGAVYDVQGKLYEAIHAYNESLERDPRQPMVLVNLATTLMKQERFPNAHRALEQAVKLDPQLAVAYERLGYCHFRLRSYGEALTHYNWAATLDPKMPEAHAGRGVVRMAMYLKEPDDIESRRAAIEHWHRSLELKPDQPKIRNLVRKYQTSSDRSETILLGDSVNNE